MRRFLLVALLLGISATTVSAQPAPAGPPFGVSQGPVFITPGPRLAVGERGESAYLWIGECPELGLCFRAYDAEGNALGDEIALDVSSQVFEAVPAVVFGTDGNLVLAWSTPGAGFERRIVGRRFRPDGTPLGAEFVIAAESVQVYDRPSIAVGAGGELVVAFEKLRFEGTTGDGEEEVPVYTSIEILARRLSPTGVPRGAVFRVDGPGPDLVTSPSVAAAPDGSIFVAWESFDVLSGAEEVLARRLTPSAGGVATPDGDEFVVNVDTVGIQRAPAAAASSQGSFLVAWESTQQGVTKVFAQVYDDAGPRFPFAFRAGSGAAPQAAPAVAGGDDVFALLWRDDRAGGSLWAQRRDADGLLLDAEFRVDVATAGAAPSFPTVGLFAGVGVDSGLAAGWTRLHDDFSRDVLGRLYPGILPPPAPCVVGAGTLCLGPGGRFELKTQWATIQGTSGAGTAETITGDTGYFWFFNANNVEAIVKVLNGCPVNGHWWVFAGGLTNVEVNLTVRDTATDQTQTYANDQGDPFQPIQDTNAFPCP